MRLPGLRTIIEQGLLGLDSGTESENEEQIARLADANAHWQKQKDQYLQHNMMSPVKLSTEDFDRNMRANNEQIRRLQGG
jgi:hypothetical protein